ncbi:MAG: MmgE/PrpD family protein [Deltaproteobacteria bacterium]|nr:MmgE/PrpD family protein [Deltaproteobacteria bacterium]
MVQMSSNGTISERLAEYVTGMAIGDLPPEVVAKTKLCILDTVGCMLAGSRDEVAASLAAHALRYDSPGPCTVFGRSGSVGPEHAALANGTSAHVLERDDGHRPSDNHLGCVVVPAALAMAQATGAPGSELLLAVTLGYDVMGRIGEAVCLPRQGQMFHGTGTTGVFGSAAAAGKLLGLTAGQLANALGVAGDGAAGLNEWRRSRWVGHDPGGLDCMPLHAGRASQSGITAALLAAEGFHGPATILEGRYGLCSAMTAEARPELICAELGRRFAVIESGFKFHAGPGGVFNPIDAALWLRKEYNLDPGSIQRIKVALPDSWRDDQARRHRPPPTVGTARYSVSFAVAAALHDGEVTHRQHTPAKLADPGIAALEERIEFITDPEVQEIFEATKFDAQFFVPCALEVECGGRSYRRLERSPLGYDPKRGLTQEQVVAKFRSLVDGVLSETQADRVVEWVLRLDHGSKVGDLSGILA